MTEQPVETEQHFLGNDTPAVVVPLTAASPRQHYAPGAHLRRPSWTPADNVQLGALARKACQAGQILAIARAEALRAEEALKLALSVEDEASTKLREAEAAVTAFIRKEAGL